MTYGFALGEVGSTYTAEQFCEVFQQLTGDCISNDGGAMSLTIGAGLSVTINSGYAYIAGHFAKLGDPVTLKFEAAYSAQDRYDAVALVLNYENREITLETLTDVDPESPVQDETQYQVFLYTVKIVRSTVDIVSALITDRRVLSDVFSDSYPDADSSYSFCTSGIEDKITAIENLGTAAAARAESKIEELNGIIENQRDEVIGDLRESKARPTPNVDWLACDGSALTDTYAELKAVIGDNLPILTADDPRLTVWMYAGDVT